MVLSGSFDVGEKVKHVSAFFGMASVRVLFAAGIWKGWNATGEILCRVWLALRTCGLERNTPVEMERGLSFFEFRA